MFQKKNKTTETAETTETSETPNSVYDFPEYQAVLEKRGEIQAQLREVELEIDRAANQQRADHNDASAAAVVLLESGEIPEQDTDSLDSLHRKKRVHEQAIRLVQGQCRQAETKGAAALGKLLQPELEAFLDGVSAAGRGLAQAINEYLNFKKS